MSRFIKNILLFLSPILLVIGFYEYLLYGMGETYSIPKVFSVQEKKQGSLYMRKYISQGFKNYKYSGILRYQPEILVLGSSRVMQFRSEFFNNKFYNAGGLVRSHKDLNSLINSEIEAKTILIGIDPWWYKEDNIINAKDHNRFSIGEYSFDITRYNSLMDYDDLISDYFSQRNKQSVGAAAQLENAGFRLDGSLKIPDSRVNLLLKEKKFVDTETPKTSKRIKNGLTSRFSFSAIDTIEFIKSAKIIKTMIDKGKDIIVYLPPFTSESYHSLRTTPEQKNFFEFTTSFMPKILKELGIKYIPVENPELYALKDTFFMDGFHPSEVFVSLQLQRHHKHFKQNINLSKIDSLYKYRYCNLLFNKSELTLISKE